MHLHHVRPRHDLDARRVAAAIVVDTLMLHDRAAARLRKSSFVLDTAASRAPAEEIGQALLRHASVAFPRQTESST